jgi:DNA-directed RNA polymerase subunit alpha
MPKKIEEKSVSKIITLPFPQGVNFIKKEKNIATFEIEGLYPGYGITLGNALRRVLLSSLEGAAVTSVKIKGVAHEFTTLPGILEDVVLITLNLKKLRFKMNTTEPQILTISKSGKGEVKGADIKTTPEVEVVNKDQLIATLTSEKAKIDMELKVEKGIGYEPIEMREEKAKTIGEILLDAIFTPVRKVSFNVENMRVGKRTDFEKLTITIETDGTITPKEAMEKAIKILLDQFNFILENIETEQREKEEGKKEEEKKEEEKKEERVSHKKKTKKNKK